mmetsp:Transcript_65822/g.122780  ORF Transcript_65822/g.122780 Transcript_65822/m.122780 type:complete len:496 (+) Transcript_65822:129-1616(+)
MMDFVTTTDMEEKPTSTGSTQTPMQGPSPGALTPPSVTTCRCASASNDAVCQQPPVRVVPVAAVSEQVPAGAVTPPPMTTCRCASTASDAVCPQPPVRVVPVANVAEPGGGVMWAQSHPSLAHSCMVAMPPATTASLRTPCESQRLQSPARVVSLARPAVALTDSCTMSPALQAWIHCIVDERLRGLRWPEIASADVARDVPKKLDIMEAQIRSIKDEKDRLLAIVERMSVEADRRYGIWDQKRGEHTLRIDSMHGMLLDLQNKVDQALADVAAKLHRHDAAMSTVNGRVVTELSRFDAVVQEVRRAVLEPLEQQNKFNEMQSELEKAMCAERDEIAALDEQLWRTDQRLGQRIADLAAKQEQLLASTDALKQAQQRLMSSVSKVSHVIEYRQNSEDLSCISPAPIDIRVENDIVDAHQGCQGIRSRTTSPVHVPVLPGGSIHISAPASKFPQDVGIHDAAGGAVPERDLYLLRSPAGKSHRLCAGASSFKTLPT